jgi:predicted secreted protein
MAMRSGKMRWELIAMKRAPFFRLAPALLSAALALAPAAAWAQTSESNLSLSQGGRSTLEMTENPSTGYVWRLDAQRSTNLAIVRIVDQGFSPGGGDRPLVGAPGRRRWSIEALTTGRAKLIFVNERPWEGRPVGEYVVDVDVR